VTEKYLDFSFEKTNSAYMLFYERRLPEHLQRRHSELLATPTPSPTNEDKPEIEVEAIIKPDKCATKVAEPSDAQRKAAATSENDEEKLNETKEADKENPEKQEKSLTRLEKEEEKQITANCDNFKSNNNKEPQASTSKAAVVADAKGLAKQQQHQHQQFRPLLSKELEDWIWQDNRQFLQDRNIFEHTYFK